MNDLRSDLLRSLAATARTVFAARAVSVSLVDIGADELVFAAVSGEGEGQLEGQRYPARAGIAGAVLYAEEPLVLDDVQRDPRFARDVAEATGYVPRALMAAPLICGEHTHGVLSVLDRGQTGRGALQEVEIMAAFAVQAATIVEHTPDAAAASELDVLLGRLTRALDAPARTTFLTALIEVLER